jgi:hypothetical protein
MPLLTELGGICFFFRSIKYVVPNGTYLNNFGYEALEGILPRSG